MNSLPYNASFFNTFTDDSARSARIIVPILLDLIAPKRVVDVGCGTGTWLAICAAHGVEIVGIDGSWVDPASLRIPPEKFVSHDLRQVYHASHRCDLALSLEVGEHLAARVAPTYVDTLVGLAPVIAFSAAIPGQPGTHHVNCQWPDYWVALFAQRGYQAIDCLRMQFWDHPDVAAYYQQNMLLFVKDSAVADYPNLAALTQDEHQRVPALVHPAFYAMYLESCTRGSLRWHLASLLPALDRAVRRRANRYLTHGPLNR